MKICGRFSRRQNSSSLFRIGSVRPQLRADFQYCFSKVPGKIHHLKIIYSKEFVLIQKHLNLINIFTINLTRTSNIYSGKFS